MYDDFDGCNDDPTSIIAPPLGAFSGEALAVSLESLLEKQITIAGELQRIITTQGKGMDVKDLKDLISTANTLISSIHRAGETLKALTTYRTFIDVIVEFIHRRADTFGDDLLAELIVVAREMRAETATRELVSRKP